MTSRLLPSDAYPRGGMITDKIKDHIDNQLWAMQYMIPTRRGVYLDAQKDVWINIGDNRWVDSTGKSYPSAYTPVLAMFAPFTDVTEIANAANRHELDSVFHTAHKILSNFSRDIAEAMDEYDILMSNLPDLVSDALSEDPLYILEDFKENVNTLRDMIMSIIDNT